MTIRLIARDLYRLEREVTDLEKRIESAPPREKERLLEELRKARADRNHMRKILEGAKEEPSCRRPR